MNIRERLAIITGEENTEDKDEFSVFSKDQFDYLAEYRSNYKEFQQMYLGNFVRPQCAVKSSEGEHCPEEIEHYVEINGKEVGLCERCYRNYQERINNDAIRLRNEFYRI
jgi:hypothetical protein